jgi:hypothetical protein
MAAQRSLRVNFSDFHFMSRQYFHESYDRSNGTIAFPAQRTSAIWNCLFVQEYEDNGLLHEVNSQTDLFSPEWIRVCEANRPMDMGVQEPPLKRVYNEEGVIFREAPYRLHRLIDGTF